MDEVEGGNAPRTSLGKAQMQAAARETEGSPNGYVELDIADFPSRGLFYPPNTRFFIRPATVSDVRHFSTVNEADPFAVAEGFADIMKGSVIVRSTGRMFSHKDILDEDRIHVLMAVREATFVKGENRMVVDTKCHSCGAKVTIELRNDAFRRAEVPEDIMRYYDQDERLFVFRTKSFGQVKVAPPTVGVMVEVGKYIRDRQRNGKEVDLSFVKLLPYIAGGWRGLNEKRLNELEVEVVGWDMGKFQFMNGIIDKVKVGVKDALHGECSSCGAEVSTAITFPGGVKALFVVSGVDQELT